MRIIPGFLVKSENEFKERLRKFVGLTSHIHIDVMDGVFVPNTTWADIAVIENALPEGMTYELHLMVNDPVSYVERTHEKVRRFVFHIESPVNIADMIRMGKEREKEVYLAINPSTSLERATMHCGAIDGILVMGNDPGFSGVAMDQEKTIARLREIAKSCPDIARSVDVGVNAETAKIVREAGATELVSTSYLTSTGDVGGAIQRLKNSKL